MNRKLPAGVRWRLSAAMASLLGLFIPILGAKDLPDSAPANQPDAVRQGRQLAQKILNLAPSDNSTIEGRLLTRSTDGTRTTIPVTCVVALAGAGWANIYEASRTNRAEVVWIYRAADQAARVFEGTFPAPLSPKQLTSAAAVDRQHRLSAAEMTAPFAGSDFSLADLALEFFQWPEQKVLRLEIHRSRGCSVLESTNPNPAPGGYARVVTWVDNETLGIVEALAYDDQGRKLKDFYPKDFKKVDDRWQVQTLVMENLQTDSRSRLEFDLKK